MTCLLTVPARPAGFFISDFKAYIPVQPSLNLPFKKERGCLECGLQPARREERVEWSECGFAADAPQKVQMNQ